jgi:hypothetical protein
MEVSEQNPAMYQGGTARVRWALANLWAAAALTGAALLYRFSPAQYRFYPRCPVFTYLHVLCPGCGGTRALAALLQLRLGDALQYNALVTILLPVIAFYGARGYWQACRGERFSWPKVPASGILAALAGALMFAIVRNLLS